MVEQQRGGRSSRPLEGRVALVAGGASGIGAASARRLVDEGAQVLIGDVREGDGEACAAALGPSAGFVRLDVTSEADWSAAVRAADAMGDGLDVLVFSAGGTPLPVPLLDLRPEDYREAVEVNQVGAFLGVQAAGRAMVARGRGGSIVLVGSILARHSIPGTVRQSTAKAAVSGLTRVAAMELVSSGVRVNCVLSGAVDTPSLRDDRWRGADARPALNAFIPFGRLGRPEELAAMVCFLASDESSYCTGAEFTVDGGVLGGRMAPTDR